MTERSKERREFEAAIRSGSTCGNVRESVTEVRAGDLDAARKVAAAAVCVAASQPGRLVDVYDAMVEGWFGHAPSAPKVMGPPSESIPVDDAFFDALFAMVEDPELGSDATQITVSTTELAGELSDSLFASVRANAPSYPGVVDAARGGLPDRFELSDLERCPQDSLGGHLHTLVVEEGFDLEVLDRDALGLRDLEPPLDYLNTRILQCHDVWHEVAGYETTGLHEIAISAFQMGQFGHHYSSLFLAMTQTTAAFTQPIEGSVLLLDVVLSSYRHGRETPPLLGVRWEDLWDQPLDQIRVELGVDPYESPYDPGLLEMLRHG